MMKVKSALVKFGPLKIFHMATKPFNLTRTVTMIFILNLVLFQFARAQHPSTIKEYEKAMTTYPFSAPDPVANASGIYPYFRFDGFTNKPVQQKWKVIALENDFIRVLIMPEIGGKIWTAIDKTNGKPFIYDNDAVKFRDVAMRGPWTSGGIELNYGMFGHTPGIATPVNFLTSTNDDGSVSCIIALLDLLTQTRWSMEIRLPKDKAYFITKSVWHNGTPIYQPYYTWMNLGEKVSDSLEYIFPGSHYLFHDGKVYDWPYNEKNHKLISIYNQNDFGSYKSYHVTGSYSQYFGTFWQKENFGMIHYAQRQDKIGKKIWIWGLSGQGMIWEKILTDHSGQYTEIQSGRLYNQNAPESVFTPFKQFYFSPYNTDTWSEYWYPFQNTGGVSFADLNAVFHVQQRPGEATVSISPVSYIRDTLKVMDKTGKIIYSNVVSLQPLQAFKQNIAIEKGDSIGKITLGESVLNLQDSANKVLDRPLDPFADFDWKSAYGLYLRGKYDAGTHHYAEAEEYMHSALQKESFFVPALTEMAYLQYRKMNYDSAFYYARKALSIDTYDPAANYYYGLAALKLNKRYDASDGFEVAAITAPFRSAAYTELSKMSIQDGKYDNAYQHAYDALINNTENITALQLQYIAARLMKEKNRAAAIEERILTLDPLNNFIRFEHYWQTKSTTDKQNFTSLIRDELPIQTYLHLADWYMDLNLFEEAEAVLQAAPAKDDEVKYWLAYLHKEDKNAKRWLDSADAGDPLFVFPFRQRSAAIMKWAIKNTDSWKPRYYLALVDNFMGKKKEALELLNNIEGDVAFAPLYVTRARLKDSADTESRLIDYTTAARLDKDDWRYGKYLTEFLLSSKENKKALNVIMPYYKKDTGNYITAMLYARCLLLNDDYNMAEKILDHINILPYEGAENGRKLYEETKLMLALQYLQKKKFAMALKKVAEARSWPENLGVGKPYPDMINSSLEDDIEDMIRNSMKNKSVNVNEIVLYRQKVKGINKGS